MKASHILFASVIAAIGSVASAQVVLDGTITLAEYGGPALAIQTVQTQFGDNNNADPKGANGSELNALFVSNDATNLFIGLTGNAETNGNQVQILIQVVGAPGGQNVIPTGGFNALTGLTLPSGFEPQMFISPNAGNGATQDIFINIHRLTTGTVQSQFLGNVPGGAPATTPTSGTFSVSLNDWSIANPVEIGLALDNSNIAGVEAGAGPAAGNPSLVTTGLEVSLPLSILEELNGGPLSNTTQLRLMAIVTNGGGDFLSNQLLPPITPQGNLGAPGSVNLQIAGGSFATYTMSFPASVNEWLTLTD